MSSSSRVRRMVTALLLTSFLAALVAVSQPNASPASESDLWKRAQTALKEHSYLPAFENFQKLVQGFPRSAHANEARYWSGYALHKLSRDNEANRVLRDWLSKPDESIWQARGRWLRVEILKSLDRWKYRNEILKELDLAVALLEKQPREEALGDLINALFDRAQQRFSGQAGALVREKAIEDYEAILRLKPQSEEAARAQFEIGNFYADLYSPQETPKDRTDRLERAVAAWRLTAQTYPRSDYAARAFLTLGDLRSNQSKFVEAVKEFATVAENYPDSPSALDAEGRLFEIKQSRISILVEKIYQPQENIALKLRLRNVAQLNFKAYSLDLFQELEQTAQPFRPEAVDTGRLTAVASWTLATNDKNDYQWLDRTTNVPLQESGAYLIVAEANHKRTGALILISRLSLLYKSYSKNFLVYTADAETGSPQPGVEIKVALASEPDPTRRWRGRERLKWDQVLSGRTDSNGLFERMWSDVGKVRSSQPLILARRGKDWAFSQGYYYGYGEGESESELAYFYTDRPVYRPAQTVYFKGIVRKKIRGEYALLERDRAITLEIRDTKSNIILNKTYTLNEFGTFNGQLELGSEPPLGNYYCQILQGSVYIGSYNFSVEEYKKPEYLVEIKVGGREASGATPLYRLGDRVVANVEAKYYFGQPVADGRVNYTVTRSPYYPWYRPFQEFGWLMPEKRARYYYGQTEVVSTGQGFTDSRGKFEISFKTEKNPKNPRIASEAVAKRANARMVMDDSEEGVSPENYIYSIEAKVVDASRREIRATEDIRVSEKSFFFYLTPERSIYSPGDRAKIKLRAQDINLRPVSTDATLEIAKVSWNEEKKKYDFSTVHTEKVSIDSNGDKLFEYTVDAEGYFKISLRATDRFGESITGEGWLWVCGKDFHGTIYRYSNVQIIADKEIYQPGETAHILINSQFPDAAILFTAEGDGLLSRQVIAMNGRSRLIELAITRPYAPNVFLHAYAIRDYKVFQDNLEITVPPTEKLLSVKIRSLKREFRPRESTELEIETTRLDGQPVSGEVSVGVVDASIYYIREETAPNIQNVFYGSRRYDNAFLFASLDYRFTSQDQYVIDEEYTRQFQVLTGRSLGPGRISVGDPAKDRAAISGKVYDSQEGPVAGAQVQIFCQTKKFVVTVGTNKNGEFSFQNLPPGQYLLTTVAPGFKRVVHPDLILGSRTQLNLPILIVSGSSMEVEAEASLALQSSSATVGAVAGRLGSPEARPPSPLMKDEAMKSVAEQREAALKTPETREYFPDTALWVADVRTDATGHARVKVNFPDSLTTWRTTARGVTQSTQVGSTTHELITTKNLLVRLEAPRFFTEKDEVTLSAIVHNYLQSAKRVKVTLAASGIELNAEAPAVDQAGRPTTLEKWIEVNPDGSSRVDFTAKIVHEGTATITASALTDEESDAVKLSFPVLPHGLEKFEGFAGGVDRAAERTLGIPKERRMESSELKITLSPSIAAVLLNALDYLAEYPYGCVEQTMSRFLPSAVVAKTLQDLGVENPKLKATLPDMMKKGLERLYDFQHPDGGWGWWKYDSSDPYMTAYVVDGLLTARDADYSVDNERLNRGLDFLTNSLGVGEVMEKPAQWSLWRPRGSDLSIDTYTLSVLAHARKAPKPAVLSVFDRRDNLNDYSRALLASTLSRIGETEKAEIMLRNIADDARVDESNQTVSWARDGLFWWWWQDGVEATAKTLEAYLAIDPQNRLVPMAMRWLVLNRRGNQWKSTKDTALTVLALTEYLKQTRELEAESQYKVFLNNQLIREGRISTKQVLASSSTEAREAENTIRLRGDAVPSGDVKLRIEHSGHGTLYYAVGLTYYTLEENIPAAGGEIGIERQYFKLTPRVNEKKQAVFDRTLLTEGASVNSGDLVEVKLTISAKNNYEYLVFEDFKPAGFEATELRSGYSYGDGLAANMELHDTRVVFFIRNLLQGKHTLTYKVRAEVPGAFHAMPTRAAAMYVPEIRANSNEFRVSVKE